MAISLHWEPRGVRRACSGDIGFDEYMQSVAELHNDLRFDTLRFIIEDFSLVESVHMCSSDVDMVIASAIGAAYSNPHIRVAAVARSASLRGLLGQFFHLSPYVSRLFDAMPAARAWIASGEMAAVPLEIQLQAAVDFEHQQLIY